MIENSKYLIHKIKGPKKQKLATAFDYVLPWYENVFGVLDTTFLCANNFNEIEKVRCN